MKQKDEYGVMADCSTVEIEKKSFFSRISKLPLWSYFLIGSTGILSLGKILGLLEIAWWVALFPAMVWLGMSFIASLFWLTVLFVVLFALIIMSEVKK